MSGITCQICGARTHVMQRHLQEKHPEVSVEQYKSMYPAAPMLSEEADNLLREKNRKKELVADAEVAPLDEAMHHMHTLFGLGNVKAALNARGEPISVRVFNNPDWANFVPQRDSGYVFPIPLLKTALQALEMNIPTLFWGHAGTGKSTLWEQVSAFTGRGFIRVQHTANTEESDIEGKWIVKGGEMIWEDGPLPLAMEKGLTYCADEYDFASPAITSMYQAVLEGKPLYIKACNRVVKPNKTFRFCATGNTNGAGDESGLYQGTQLQNAANYERFGIVERVDYMPEASEIAMIVGKTGMARPAAEKLVEFARTMRKAFDQREVAIPMSPRATLNASKIGLSRDNLRYGVQVSYINRLPQISATFAEQVAQRIIG